MKSILKRILKPSKQDPFSYQRGITTKPIESWKRNTFAVLAGVAIGLYAGQYFPDVLYDQVDSYLP